MGGAGFAPMAIAQEKHRSAGVSAAQAETAAGGEVECLGLACNIGHYGGDGMAGQCLFGSPEQFDDRGRPDQYQRFWRKTERDQAGTVGETHFLSLTGQLQIDHNRSLAGQQAAGLRQGKAKRGSAIAPLVCENLLDQSPRENREAFRIVRRRGSGGFGEGRAALDIGNAGA